MSANEFEKQVQRQLDDFQLNPSASVWKKVEEQIRKKRRRRVILFFLLPVALGLLSYSVYYFVHTGQKTEQVQQQVTARNNNSSTTDINKTPETKEQPIQSTTDKKINPDELTITKPEQKAVNSVKSKTEKSETEFQIVSGKPSVDRRKNKPASIQVDDITIAKKKENTSKDNHSLVPDNNVQTNNEVVVTIDKPGTGRITKDEMDKQPLTVNDQSKEVVVSPNDQVTVKTDSAKAADVIKTTNKETIAKKHLTKPKIKWGIDFSTGIASNQSQVFSFSKSYDSRLAYSSPATSGSFPGGGGAITLPPSSVKPGVVLRIGVVGEMKISNRSKVSMGLQYAYASNRIKTGTADRALRLQLNNNLSAMVDQVYRGPQENSYTNNYHFISIPVSWHWQINKSKKLPVQWNVGISPGYVVATDALVYSSSNGGSYYYDKEAINKFHFSVGTGLSLRLKAKKGMEYILGPEISVDTRKLINNAYEKKPYLIYWGMGARLLFPQRKNK